MTIKKDKNGLSEKLLDELMQTCQKPEDLPGKNSLRSRICCQK
jgi:hypothetical protein